MMQILVGVYDITSEALVSIQMVNNEKVAIRDLDGIVNTTDPNRQGSLLQAHPSDFTLRRLGVIDTATGVITTQTKDVNGNVVSLVSDVINLGSLVNSVKSAVKADDLPNK